MESILKNITPKNVITYPFPHLDIIDAVPKNLYQCMVDELPSEKFLDDYFSKLGNLPSAVALSSKNLKTLGLKTPYIDEFISIHSNKNFLDNILNLFSDYYDNYLPNMKYNFLNAVETKLFINPKKTIVSEIENKNLKKTFVRGPHIDDPGDFGVFLFYICRGEDNIIGGDLDLYKYKTRFRGFRRDIWYDEREFKMKDVEKVKTISYTKNRFIFLLDSLYSIHGVTPIDSRSKGYRMRLSGGVNTVPKSKNYNYRDYLSTNEILLDIAGIQLQKVLRKINKFF